MNKNILIVIPARGGSKGIPRKNLRSLAGKPLISYAINTALSLENQADVYVSSDDEEILNLSRKYGAKTIERDSSISNDTATLDPVIFDALYKISEIENKQYDLVITMQPTSPLLKASSIDKAIQIFHTRADVDTVIAAVDDTHLSWRKEDNRFVPNYKERVNRQYLTPLYKETGGFFISRREIVQPQSRIGGRVELSLLSPQEAIDIDTYEDWSVCEYFLKKKKILFVITGNDVVGLGHVYNTLIIANDIMNHQIEFLVDFESSLAYEKIASQNYPVFLQSHENIIEDIYERNPDIIINDCLDTEASYIKELKSQGLIVANFEDLGEGAKYADLVINAIYPEKEKIKNHYFGPDYFILRDEFLLSQKKAVKEQIQEILITFGGVDPKNYTRFVLEAIYDFCSEKSIEITVVAGYGYDKYETISSYRNVNIIRNAVNISDYMLKADIIFTSAGRTTYEIASIGTPAIVLAQNERELTHFFASEDYGFVNLGLGYKKEPKDIKKRFIEVIEDYDFRMTQSKKMEQYNLKSGRINVNRLINSLIWEDK